MSKFTPTPEQQTVVDLAMEGYDLRINAFAGASKTTTCTLIAEAKDEEGGNVGMYLAFNKVTALEAENRFPSSVECRTVHSLAYRHTPKNLIAKLKNQKIFPKELGEMYKVNGTFLDSKSGDQKYVSVGQKISMINKTVTRFCNSADDDVGEQHLVKIDWMYTPVGEEYDFTNIMAEVLEMARHHWNEIINPESLVPMTHEAYLKLYSMKGRQLACDYIMIDENQDSSPVILKIVEAQKKAQKIYVGDKYQAIYGWRGAVNAMEFVTGKELYLTKSFRFGDNVEKIANMLLSLKDNEIPLSGNGSSEGKTYLNNMPYMPNAVISRTNAGVIKNIFEYGELFPNASIGASCDLREIESFVYAYNDLSSGKRVEHKLLFAFNTIKELREYCEENPEDMEISGLVALIDKFSPKSLIAAIKRCEAVKEPDIMITTAHKSKGLEWDNVKIMDDFFYDTSEGRLDIEPEEINLLYVACTRAKKHIDIGGIADLMMFLYSMHGDKESLVSLGFIPEDAQYGNDEVAIASGGVLTSNSLPVEVKGLMQVEGGVNADKALRKFIDKTCNDFHQEMAEMQDHELGITNFGVEV